MQAKSWVRKWLDFVKKFTVDGKSKSQFYWASCCCRNRAEMGLTDRRRTAKNLSDSRKNWKILTVSRKWGKKELTVKEVVP